jgi:phage regulator Rha-like protein
MSAINAVTTTKGEARIDSRLIAQHLGIKHRNLFELVESHKCDFAELGILRFQTGVIRGRGQPEKFVLLNEDQAYLLLTYSRNTKKVCTLKLALVKSFGEARRALSVRQIEYLPAYHALHDAIKTHADGSANERFYHMNANRELNKLAGVQAGHRASAGLLQQSLLAVGSALAARAVTEANEGSLHQHIKAALKPLEGVLAIGCS